MIHISNTFHYQSQIYTRELIHLPPILLFIIIIVIVIGPCILNSIK